MAHYAEIDENNIVKRVIVVNNSDCLKDGVEDEATGAAFCHKLLGGTWIQTSYNTHAGVNARGAKAIKKNYAGIGYVYDKDRDAFIPPKPFKSWVLNEDTCQHEAPVKLVNPKKGFVYYWNEDKQMWDENKRAAI